MPAARNTMQWLREFERLPTTRPVAQSRQGQGARPAPVRAQQVQPRANTRAWLIGDDAGLPQAQQVGGRWVVPQRTGSGITQEPNSAWGVAFQDPLWRQGYPETIGGLNPVLRPWGAPRPAMRAPTAGGYAPSYSSGYGGGYGGGGWGASYPETASNLWWDPGLYNWRYGVSY